MNSETKKGKCDKWCQGCEEYTDELADWATSGTLLCEDCNEKYENRTGYCSLECCLGHGCDGSC